MDGDFYSANSLMSSITETGEESSDMVQTVSAESSIITDLLI